MTRETDTPSWLAVPPVFKDWRTRLGLQGDRARSGRDAMLAFTIRVVSAGLLYLSQIALARWMGAQDYGIYVLAWTWVLVLGGLSHLGLAMVMVRDLPAYAARGEHDAARGLLWTGRCLALGVGTAVAAFGMLMVWLFADRFEPQRIVPTLLALACVPLFALTDLQDGIGRGRGWMLAGLGPPYVLRPLVLLLVMLLAHAIGVTLDAVAATSAAIIATAAAVIVQAALLRQRFAGELPAGPRRTEPARWAAMALPLLIIYAAELVHQNADVVVLSMHRPAADVGMYFAAAKTMALVLFVHYAVGSAMAHRFSALATQRDHDGLARAVRDASRWTFWPSLAVAALLLMLGRPLLALFAPGFADAYPVMAVLMVGFLARAAVGPVEHLLSMLGEQRLCAAVVAGSALCGLVLQVVLVPWYGALGAATATAAGLTLQAIAGAVVAWRRLGLNVTVLPIRTR
jgi:O-antigen/teichoic acid export membrane protein